jgi:fatty acid desaturase
MKQAGQPSKFSVSLEQQQLSPLRLRVSLLVVAIVTLGLATHDNSGLISRISLIWLTISIASSIVLLHFWYAPLQHVAGFRREWLLALLAAGLTFRLPDVGRVFAGNFGNGDGTFFCKNGKDMAG